MVIDLGILSPSELKDIVLSKFIALLLQVLPLLAFHVGIIHKQTLKLGADTQH